MSRLNDVLSEAVEAKRSYDGSVDLHDAYKMVDGTFERDDEVILIKEASLIRMKDIASRGRSAILKQSAGQGEFPFPNIRRGHAIDTNGHRIKNTESMLEVEFARLIEIREEQIKNDQAYLDDLRDAFNACKPYWREHPAWTFGRVCEEMMRRVNAA